jgi:hypothetical protein
MALQVICIFLAPTGKLRHDSFQDAQANGFVASLKDNASEKMGMLHAAYGALSSKRTLNGRLNLCLSGAGALASPLVATQFAQLRRWSFLYLVSLGIAVTNTVALIAVFSFKTQDGDSHFLSVPKPV